ncbi:hypothetical protein E4U41_000698 [Claviceps citrina]|nr:hypothetical protein E4U41_000698 [Claviceps citrina]
MAAPEHAAIYEATNMYAVAGQAKNRWILRADHLIERYLGTKLKSRLASDGPNVVVALIVPQS